MSRLSAIQKGIFKKIGREMGKELKIRRVVPRIFFFQLKRKDKLILRENQYFEVNTKFFELGRTP